MDEYREALEEWSAWHEVIEQTLDFVRNQGYFVGAGLELGAALPEASGTTGELREQLIAFVRGESAKANVGERLPGSTEVLESCFGKLKALEQDQSKSGFTGLVLSVGAMVSKRSMESIREGLEMCRVRDVWAWCKQNRQGFSHREADAKSLLDEAFRRGIGGSGSVRMAKVGPLSAVAGIGAAV